LVDRLSVLGGMVYVGALGDCVVAESHRRCVVVHHLCEL